MPVSVKRLFKELKPQSYKLRLELDIDALKFKGVVIVRLKKSGRPSQRITFHQHGLKVTSAKITKLDKKGQHAIPIVRINNQDTLDEVRLHTSELVYAGEYEVEMMFEGNILKGMTGIYPSYFKYGDTEHVMLATQFESHHAREAFPCIDELEAKATFELTLVTPINLTVLSNTPIAQAEKLDKNELETVFETTPIMSTYLLAFAVGELHCKSSETKRGTKVSVWGTITQPADAFDFALKTAVGCIEFFEQYFGIEYPLAKADHLALPDFSSGAMENWGLITYRERVLLAYPDETSQSTLEWIALVIAHETSHQWFGNLVTMRWWDDLWLNESFANLMEFQAPDALFPDWHIWNEFIAGDGLSALRRDASPDVQALRTDIHHPIEINTLFDPSIVYAKGGRLLYMLKTFLGEKSFRVGLTAYFKKHAYGNTTRDDLWEAFHATSGIDVAGFMNPWLDKPGFPVISVDQQGQKVTITQQRFFEDGRTPDGSQWPVPLFFNHQELPSILTVPVLKFELKDDKPLIINSGAAGHYIVRYMRPEHNAYFAKKISAGELPVADRLMLLNNASMLSKANYAPFAEVMRLLAAYTDETNEAVWGVMSLVTGEARRFIELDESLEDPIKRLMRALIRKEYARLGWERSANEASSDTKQRATILALGAYAGEPDIVNEALNRYKMFAKETSLTDPELRAIVFSVPVREGTNDAFNFLLKLYDKTANGDLKTDIMSALCTTQDVHQAEQLTDRLTDSSLVKPQDVDHWLAYLLRNRHVREVAWRWMEEKWQWLEETFSHDKSYDYLPRYAAGACNTRYWANKYETFYGPKQDQIPLKRNITIGLSEIKTRVAWLERDLSSVQKFLKSVD